MNSFVIVAAGTGTRFGKEIPKQFVKLDGREIIDYSVSVSLSHPNIDEVIIVSHPDWQEYLIKKYPLCCVVTGGTERWHSSRQGVAACSDSAVNILIHDAARPCVTHSLIDSILSELENCDAAVPSLTISDSTVLLDRDRITYLDRKNLRTLQTPQGFRSDVIRSVLKVNQSGTDDLSIVLQNLPGINAKLIPGDRNNIKVTTSGDILITKQILNGK